MTSERAERGEQGRPALAGPAPEVRLPWRRLLSFAGLPLVAALAPLLLIPVVSGVGGVGEWTAVALGQSLGAGAATVLQYGWAFAGPPRVALAPDAERRHLLWVSTLSRLLVAALVVPAAALAAGLLAPPGEGGLAAVTAVAFATFGLSGFWYFVGVGRAGLAATYETVPRLLVLLAAALVVLRSGETLWYPVLLLAGQVLMLAWLNLRLGAVSLSGEAWRAALQVLRGQRAAAGVDLVAAVYQAAPAALVAVTAPAALPVFASGERLQRLAQSGVQPLFNAFQGWVSESPPDEVRGRMRLAVTVTSALGLLAGLLFAVGLPVVDRWVFAGEVSVGFPVSALFGAALALFALTSSVSFHVLSPARLPAQILRSAVAGGAVVLGALLVLPPLWGAAGGAAALVAAQLAVLGGQIRPWRRVLHAARTTGGP